MNKYLADREIEYVTNLSFSGKKIYLGLRLLELAKEHRRVGELRGQQELHELYATQLELTYELLCRSTS